MIKELVLQHKAERDRLQSKSYIPREKLEIAHKFLDSDLIKVVTGPRRAGKSVFSILLLKNRDFAYLNFDDEELLKVKNYDEIVKAIFEVYPQAKFALFDEIQNLSNWELFVNKLQRRGFNLILTGSNAHLLNQELGTVLTGRHIPIEIFPFSFREFLKANDFELKWEEFSNPEVKGKLLNYLDNYLRCGGFPEVVVKKMDFKVYLETLFDAVLFKHIVKRYKVRFSQKIYDLAVYLVSNFSSLFSANRLKNILGFRSTHTVEKYLRYLQEAYLILFLNRFSFKIKEHIKTPKKVYPVDNGFISAKSFQFSQNYGKLIESLVMVEIVRRGYKVNRDVFYYKKEDNTGEVDFVLKEATEIKELLQVCYRIDEQEAKEREIKALIGAGEKIGCDNLTIITWDYGEEEKHKGKVIKFIPLWKWLWEKCGNNNS